MIINREHLENALSMTISDYADDDNHINHDELANIKTRFSSLIGQLMEQCEDKEYDDGYGEDDKGY